MNNNFNIYTVSYKVEIIGGAFGARDRVQLSFTRTGSPASYRYYVTFHDGRVVQSQVKEGWVGKAGPSGTFNRLSSISNFKVVSDWNAVGYADIIIYFHNGIGDTAVEIGTEDCQLFI